MTTYVFDFYNRYIPGGHQSENRPKRIRIEPLAQAEEFAEKRREDDSKYAEGDWRTAKCYTTADDESEAKRWEDADTGSAMQLPREPGLTVIAPAFDPESCV